MSLAIEEEAEEVFRIRPMSIGRSGNHRGSTSCCLLHTEWNFCDDAILACYSGQLVGVVDAWLALVISLLEALYCEV